MKAPLTEFEKGQLHELKHISVYGKEFINQHGFGEYVVTRATLVKNKRDARSIALENEEDLQGAVSNSPSVQRSSRGEER